jgi:hypothetical protein
MLQRARRIVECRPVLDRAAIRDTLGPRDRYTPLLCEPAVDDRQEFTVDFARRLQLLERLVPCVGFQDLIAR